MVLPEDIDFILKIKPEYCRQPWYHEDAMILLQFHRERYIPNFGYDCELKNLRTGEVTNLFNSYLTKLDNINSRDIKINIILENEVIL